MSAELFAAVAGVLCATAFGSMVFFSAVVAPLVFTRLPAEAAGAFIRQLFPVYYLVLAGLTGAAALLVLGTDGGNAALFAIVAGGFVYARQVLMPRINALRDAELAGDAEAAPRFARAHRGSVVLNAVQMIALLVALVRFL